jgi:hypothetical protein
MSTKDCAGGKSRWQYCQESTLAISKKLDEYDPDGITVVPFSGSPRVYPNTTVDKVDKVFQENEPMGGTNLSAALQVVFDDYLDNKKKGTAKPNGILALVVTDGQPDDEDAVAKAIVNFTKKLDPTTGDEEAGISFVQIGQDTHATAYLKRLDDHLQSEGAKWDIVNARTMEEVERTGVLAALHAAIEE